MSLPGTHRCPSTCTCFRPYWPLALARWKSSTEGGDHSFAAASSTRRAHVTDGGVDVDSCLGTPSFFGVVGASGAAGSRDHPWCVRRRRAATRRRAGGCLAGADDCAAGVAGWAPPLGNSTLKRPLLCTAAASGFVVWHLDAPRRMTSSADGDGAWLVEANQVASEAALAAGTGIGRLPGEGPAGRTRCAARAPMAADCQRRRLGVVERWCCWRALAA